MRLFRCSLAAVAAAVLAAPVAGGADAIQRISTVAGNGVAGYSGDAALTPLLSEPRGLAVLPDGSFLVAEAFANAVVRVYPDGSIATVAGNGEAGYSGDGGPATASRLNQPHELALTPDGGFLIADALNNCIRKVAADGTITTVAGTGSVGSFGDGGPATRAQLAAPHGVASLPDGGFLIADTVNNRIRRVSADGTITTVAGTGTPGFTGDGSPATQAELAQPAGIAVTADGGMLIALAARIRRVAPDGTISTVAGTGLLGYSGDGGPATSAQLRNPHNVFALPDGGFVIADTFNNRVRRVSPDGTIMTIAGNGEAGFAGDGGNPRAAEFDQPKAVVPFGNGFLIADAKNGRVRRVAVGAGGAATISTVAGNVVAGGGAGGLARSASLNHPSGVAAASDSAFLVADTFNNRIRRIARDGTITTVAGTGARGNGGDGGLAVSAQLSQPSDVVATADGGFLIADTFNNRIRRVDSGGTITTVAGTGSRGFGGDGGPATNASLSMPRGVATLRGGGFLIADTGNNRIRFVSRDGRISTVAGTGVAGDGGDGGPAVAARLRTPFAVSQTQGGGFLIADTFNSRIRKVTPSGKITTVAGRGAPVGPGLERPFDVASLRSGGFLVVDGDANVVRRVRLGTVTTVAGGGRPGFGGDGGPSVSARLNHPHGVAALPDGSFLIADFGNNRIRLVAARS